ncbi:MAG: GIY-YIG nuclease family protein [Firmicutes bacterium]|nr:GIY-YIG nuclease family protein [Lachnospiraceae bacterium]MDD6066503.1 GIY-YIG nuclease family protein [Bacillota bacterium]MDY2818817.1 GIY-YIG nuclease family protein [Hominisplanchenecus sp.]
MERKEKAQSCYTYIVRCQDDTLYTGWTTDLARRITAHNSGKGAKYTKSRSPVELVYYESFTDKREAMRREYAIKQLARKEKENLIRQHKENRNLLSAPEKKTALKQKK